MAPRGRGAIASEGGDRSYDSSPDPLALSTNENKVWAMRRTASKAPLTTSSPSKQNRSLGVEETEYPSPSKSIVMSTPRMGNASPWRIKVTVQAEPGSDEENTESPSVKRVTRTKTTTIPLKDADSQSPSKRPRGRPRKSDVGAAVEPTRGGTPVKKAPNSKSEDASAGAVESSGADVDTDAPPKKRRGRPRKSVQPPTEDEEIRVVHALDAQVEPSLHVTPVPVSKPKASSSKKSARFASPSLLVPVIATTDATSQLPLTDPPQGKRQDGTSPMLPPDKSRRKFLAEYELPVLDTPPHTDLGKKLRARKGTPHSKKVVPVHVSSDEESGEDSDLLTPTSGEEHGDHQEAAQDPFAPRATPQELHTPNDASSARSSVDERDSRTATEDSDAEALYAQAFEEHEDVEDITNFALEEGATRMPDDTTVLDSENFSMISVESLASNRGMSSPPKLDEPQDAITPSIGSLLHHEYLGPSTNMGADFGHQVTNEPSAGSFHGMTGLISTDSLRLGPSPRYKTPVIDTEVPSGPPAIEAIDSSIPKTEIPRLGRVVTAGVALQGVLDPTHLTPQPSQKALDEKHDELDDLFRGFSEGTRKELQAGLRLGEQLAQGQTKESSSPALSSPINAQLEAAPKEDFYRTLRKYRQSRLLTPDEQDGEVAKPTERTAEANDVQYPSLDIVEVENPLLSPARSEEAMSEHQDTPPETTTSADHRRFEAIGNERREMLRAPEISVVADASNHAQQDDYSDIWQEEASRSSSSPEVVNLPAENSSQLQDLLAGEGMIRPARGKLPRTWRRKSTNHFQYSDEAESPQQTSRSHTDFVRPVSDRLDKGKAKLEEISVPVDQEMEEEDATSDASDDTGMFFQSNMPNVFNNKRSAELKQRKADKQRLSSLLNEGESLLPESSPPAATKKSPPASKTNPFLDTPPRFLGFPSSPKKSSPLRRELRSSDISSESQRCIEDESTLPLAQSSPFHTLVDGESGLSTASDQRQFRVEMEGSTASTIRRVRNEANEYLDAYRPQERSLDEITEVTEPSRTWYKDTSVIPSSPPYKKRSFEQSILSPTRRPVPLFSSRQGSTQMTFSKLAQSEEVDDSSEYENTEDSSSPASLPNKSNTSAERPQQQQTGLFSRMTSTLFEALSRPAPPPPHPILSRFTPLPKIEPWTKTHYKALDKLYTTHLKHPALFSPSIVPATPLSQTNTYLLNQFLSHNNERYVGATFSVWDYSMIMNEELVVLCAVYMQLLSLEGIDEYEEVSGREIQMGDCAPGRSGDAIKGDDVVRRLATVIIGESVRRDEKAGKKIEKEGTLTVEWPR